MTSREIPERDVIIPRHDSPSPPADWSCYSFDYLITSLFFIADMTYFQVAGFDLCQKVCHVINPRKGKTGTSIPYDWKWSHSSSYIYYILSITMRLTIFSDFFSSTSTLETFLFLHMKQKITDYAFIDRSLLQWRAATSYKARVVASYRARVVDPIRRMWPPKGQGLLLHKGIGLGLRAGQGLWIHKGQKLHHKIHFSECAYYEIRYTRNKNQNYKGTENGQ